MSTPTAPPATLTTIELAACRDYGSGLLIYSEFNSIIQSEAAKRVNSLMEQATRCIYEAARTSAQAEPRSIDNRNADADEAELDEADIQLAVIVHPERGASRVRIAQLVRERLLDFLTEDGNGDFEDDTELATRLTIQIAADAETSADGVSQVAVGDLQANDVYRFIDGGRTWRIIRSIMPGYDATNMPTCRYIGDEFGNQEVLENHKLVECLAPFHRVQCAVCDHTVNVSDTTRDKAMAFVGPCCSVGSRR